MVRVRTLALALAAITSVSPLLGQVGDDIPLGVEVVTGYRSEYVYRGFKLASEVLDVQLESEIALSNEWFLSVGGWYGSGAGGFSEVSGFAELVYEVEDYWLGLQGSYHRYRNGFFRDGMDVGATFNWGVMEDLDLSTGVFYDTGAKGVYAMVEAAWSKPLSDDSFISVLGGVGGHADYYERSGLGDFYTRLAYTYTFNAHVAVTPFVGTSLALDSDRRGGDYVFAGLWFEVNF